MRVVLRIVFGHVSALDCHSIFLAKTQGSKLEPRREVHLRRLRGCAGDCESAVRMNARVIQVRPSQNPRLRKQGGWTVFEADGVSPVYCGPNAREQALSYARKRAGYGPR